MPTAHVNGVDLYYEDTGRGFLLVWRREFGGDYRSWEPQARHFSRRHRVITYNHRGYPPSSVPEEPEAYTQDRPCVEPSLFMRLDLPNAGLVVGPMTGHTVNIEHRASSIQ